MTEQLKPCPFCGSTPKIELGKKQYCQTHGDPSQEVIVRCPNRYHTVIVGAGDVYNGGEAKAREEAIERWNTRTGESNDRTD